MPDFIGIIFTALFYQPLFNVLMVLYNLFGGNLGWAIIAVAAILKILTIPITSKQIESAKKMKVFQEETKKIKKLYSKNKEKLNEELMKLNTKYMPAQLGGCLPLIVTIILLFQIRSVVIDLVDKGYHSFNKVAYVETLKKQEDSIKFTPETALANGEHKFKIELASTDGKVLSKEYVFDVVDDVAKREGEIKAEYLAKPEQDRKTIAETEKNIQNEERKTDISVYNDLFSKNQKHITISQFLFFTTEQRSAYIMTEKSPSFDFYIRPPSNQTLIHENTKIYFDGVDVTAKSTINKGEKLNLDFAWMNLSRVGSDFWGNWLVFLPYLLLAVFIGITQYFTSKIQMGTADTSEKKKDEKSDEKKQKKKEKEKDEPDFAEIMQESSRQMVYTMPVATALISLGVLGGANLFPAAVSLFWTAQNLSVIIQQAYTKRRELKERIGKMIEKSGIMQRLNKQDIISES